MFVYPTIGVLYLLTVYMVYHRTKMKYSKINLTDVNSLLSDILEINFKNNSLSNAAQSIILVLRKFYNIDYVTIMIYKERTDSMEVIASNAGNSNLRVLENHCNSILKSMKNLSGKTSVASNNYLDYPSAKERSVSFASFTPLESNKKLIGAILLENKTTDSLNDGLLRLDLYNKVFKSTALVLQNVIYTENLISMTSSDQLTGVYNRRYIDIALPEQLSTHRNLGMSCAVVMFDIDHFKKFNDTYGHSFGDLVLQDVAGYIKALLGENEWIARYGGEEFIIFFGRTTMDNAYARVEKFREGLSNLKLTDGKQTATVSASFGLASSSDSNLSANDIVKKADEALYESKRNGRNRVTISK